MWASKDAEDPQLWWPRARKPMQSSADPLGLIASVGVLVIVLLGYWYVIQSLLPSSSKQLVSQGQPLAIFVSFVAVYTLGIEALGEGILSYQEMLPVLGLLMLGTLLMTWVETAVVVAAITLLLMKQVSVFGPASLTYFFLLLVAYLVGSAVLRRSRG